MLPYAATSRLGAVGEPCDLEDAAAVRALIRRVSPAVVVHCAARVPASAGVYAEPGAAEASCSMMRNLAREARCRIIFTSSMTVYGPTVIPPANEALTCSPDPGYATGKWMAEQILFARGLSGDVALRLPGLFGLPRRSGVLYNAAKAFLTGGDIELTETREPWAAIAVEDAADYLVRAATRSTEAPAQAVNVAYEADYSVAAAVGLIAGFCGRAWVARTGKPATFSMTLERLASLYGVSRVPFDGRLRQFVDDVRRDCGLQPPSTETP